MKIQPQSHNRERSGAVVVEFAIVTPIMLMLVLGCLEVGRAIMVQQALTDAARAAARKAILDGTTNDDIEDIVDSACAASKITNHELTMDPTTPSNANLGDPITITVTVNFQDVTWTPILGFLGNVELSGTCIMSHE